MAEDELLAADSEGQEVLKKQKEVLEIIEQAMGEGKKGQRLTWQALHSLTQQ